MARLKYAWERGSAHWNTQSKHSIFLINELSKWVFLPKSVNSRYGLAYEVVADGILKSAIKRNHSFTLSHIFRAGPWSRGRLVIVSSRQTSTARRFSKREIKNNTNPIHTVQLQELKCFFLSVKLCSYDRKSNNYNNFFNCRAIWLVNHTLIFTLPISTISWKRVLN